MVQYKLCNPGEWGMLWINLMVTVHAAGKTLREALWFEVNPHLKDSAQETPKLCGLCERSKTLLGVAVNSKTGQTATGSKSAVLELPVPQPIEQKGGNYGIHPFW